MEKDKIELKIAEIETQIAELPIGSISKKKVNGNIYYYHRWYEGKNRKEKYISPDVVEALRSKIELRKRLQGEAKSLKMQIEVKSGSKSGSKAGLEGSSYYTNIRTAAALRSFSGIVKNYRKRDCFKLLNDFVYGEQQDKVLILYGLRRTGKTTLIRQIIADMKDRDIQKTAFIQITPRDTLADVNHDIKLLEDCGYRYIFIDEVTLLEDFIEGAALFSDVFAASGMKIVLSGTDSLGFLFSEDEALYDRCVFLHTTMIPYREFENVLGISGIDEYIRYGGTMSLGGINYNETSTFSSRKSTDEYVDSAIARNIQHSLVSYQDGGHFRHLYELYEKNELTSAINRVVEDINHRFTLEVLTRDFKSNDLALSSRNLLKDKNEPVDIVGKTDIAAITLRLRNLLEIRNRSEQTVTIEAVHKTEIREYLNMLDLIVDIDEIYLPDISKVGSRTVIAQPGLRYAQAEALIKSLLLDKEFSSFSLEERNRILERIRSEIRGRMSEDIVLLETRMAFPEKQVFKLQFAVGEFDMVVFDPSSSSCEIYEIKHSTEVVSGQYRHLIDEKKCADTEFRYGKITGKYVLYRGSDTLVRGIRYINVEKYLNSLDFDYASLSF